MNVSALSIRHPVPAVLLFALLTLLGLSSFHNLGIQNFPDIEVPTIIINAGLEGAAPGQLETEVARKIEDKVAALGGIEHIRTTLTDGSVTIAVEFNIDKDVEEALNEVRNAIDSVRADLPQDLNDPVVSKVTTSGSPILTYSIESSSMDETDLSWFVDNDVSKMILAVKGVGKFSRIGGVDREIHVDLDANAMASLNVTPADVSSRLRQVQRDASGGRGDVGGGIQSFRVLGAVATAADIAKLDIPLADGRRVRLEDIAKVSDTHAERSTIALLDGKQVIGFNISRIKGASEVAVAQAVREAVATFQKQHPQVQIQEAFDTVAPVLDNFEGSMHLLYEGGLLAILVVWWFLRDWRATLVSAVALPLSIIPTFLIMDLCGFSLNTLTLLALALVVGVLVDDAIVEVENIVRHLHMGKKPFAAAMEAAQEIGLAVIATTFTLVAVFLPTAFMGGVPGKFFKPFGITAAASVLVSLMVARLLTPMMAAYFLKAQPLQEEEGKTLTRYLGWVRWCLDHRKTTMLLATLFFFGSVSLIPLLPTGFIPVADRSQSTLKLELQPGSTLQETEAVTRQALAIIKQVPDVTSVFAAVGSAASDNGGPLAGSASSDVRKVTLTLKLVYRSDRSRTQSEVERDVIERLRQLPGTRVSQVSTAPGERLQVTLASDDPIALDTAAKAVEKDLRTLQGIGGVTSAASLQRPEIHVIPDYAKAADVGVTAAALASTVRIATNGDYDVQLSKLNLPQRQIPIRVRLDTQVRSDLTAIRQLPVPGRSGAIPLDAVASVQMSSGPSQIDRLDRLRNTTFNVDLGGRVIGDVMKEVDRLPSLQNLPPSVKRPVAGDAQRMQELFGSFGGAMLIGVLCIYIVLVLLFHDFLQPATILAALPLSLGGAFVALLVTHNAFSMPSVIGILMLMGIVTKNSILLVEYAVVARRERGMSRLDAIMDACRKRARPILMTTIAMVAGMMPNALGFGAEPSFRSPMAIAVIGGLLTSTVLSLIVIPVVFTYVDDLLLGLKGLVQRLWRREPTELATED